MAYVIPVSQPESKLKPVKRALVSLRRRFAEGQWGISIRAGHTDYFIGVVASRVIVPPLVNKPIPPQAKGRFIPFAF